MALIINCDICGEELKEPGALLFSPPQTTYTLCVKSHICKGCFAKIENLIEADEI